MKDAVGGVLTIQIIVIFLVLINGYLAFNVNYTKAFRVKNEIISIIEKNEGFSGDLTTASCNPGDRTNAICQIRDYLNNVGYNNEKLSNAANCGSYTTMPGGYCLKATHVGINNDDELSSQYRGTYYSVITFVNIDIPILNMLFEGGAAFQVRGETRLIYSSGT